MSKLRIIVGQGTATEVYRATVSEGDWDTVVIGPKGLWAAMPQGHRMGQPPHLLQLSGQKLPQFQVANGENTVGMGGFLDVNTYQQRLQQLALSNNQRTPTIELSRKKEVISLATCRVTAIFREKGQIAVKTVQPNLAWLADQVILCTGIGPQMTLAAAKITVKESNRPGFLWNPLIEGIDYLSAPGQYASDIAIYGGGATAAWVADLALQRGTRKLAWIARPTGSKFDGCFLPGSRNAMVLARTFDLRMLATINEVSFLPEARFGGRVVRKPKVRLEVTREGEKGVMLVDQLVYSIGGDSKGNVGVRQMIHPSLLNEVGPVLDRGRVVSDGTGVLALATPKRDLMIVGSATYNFATSQFEKREAPMHELPPNAQVPDGIAMVNSSITALNEHIGDTNELNLNTGNRNQVAVWVATRYPHFDNETANTAVEAIIGWRKEQTFGIDPAKVDDMLSKLLGL